MYNNENRLSGPKAEGTPPDCDNERVPRVDAECSATWSDMLLNSSGRNSKSTRSRRPRNARSKSSQTETRTFPCRGQNFRGVTFEDLVMSAPQAWTPDVRRALLSKQDINESKLIARVTYGGDVIPGWANHRGECHVAWGGQVSYGICSLGIPNTPFPLICGRCFDAGFPRQGIIVIAPRRVQFLQESENLSWVPWTGTVPRNAVLAGRTSYGENTFVGRYEMGHEKIPGSNFHPTLHSNAGGHFGHSAGITGTLSSG